MKHLMVVLKATALLSLEVNFHWILLMVGVTVSILGFLK